MQSIFSRAEKVIAWLGPDYDGGAEALRLVDRMVAAANLQTSDFRWLKTIPELYKSEGDDKSHVLQRWEGISQLFDRPYWSRVWILQEAVLARELLLMCGTERTTFNETENFQSVLFEISANPEFLLELLSRDITVLVRNINWRNWFRISSFRALMREYSNNFEAPSSKMIALNLNLLLALMPLHATDPRGKIYGLLGIVESTLKPDYTKDAREVFTNMAKSLLLEEGMSVLAYATTFVQSGVISALPSWVPDWQLLSADGGWSSLINHEKYEACGRVGLTGHYLLRSNVLGCSGLLLDCVTRSESNGSYVSEDLVFLHNIRVFMERSYEYPNGLTKLQALILASNAAGVVDTDFERLQITSQSWPAAVAAFIFYLVDECHEVTHLSVRESYNLVKTFMWLGLREYRAEKALIDLCFRGCAERVALAPVANPVFEVRINSFDLRQNTQRHH
jgi:hypothetical protein